MIRGLSIKQKTALCVSASLVSALLVFSESAFSALGDSAETGEQKKIADSIRSNIRLHEDGRPLVEFGNISQSDPVRQCPIETMPPDLANAVDRLVVKVRSSVDSVKQARGGQCDLLDRQLESSRSEVNNAIQYHFLASNTVNTNDVVIDRQNAINQSTRQASAVNGLVLTTTELLNRECIESVDARIMIQRMLGQVITLGGLFMGGWEGVGLAAGGQLFASLPIFKNPVDQAIKLFQKYDEINERGGFLCLYRNMQKTSCLMFSDPTSEIIDGLDTTLRSGPGQQTRESVERLEVEKPDLLADAKLLWKVEMDSRSFLSYVEQHFETISESPMEHFYQMRIWCQETEFGELKSEIHPASVVQALSEVQAQCDGLGKTHWRVPLHKEIGSQVYNTYWNLKNLGGYYGKMRSEVDSPIEYVINTWESFKYFEGVKDSIQDFTARDQGNQSRVNYHVLTHELGKTLAADTFKRMFDADHYALTGKKWYRSPVHRDAQVKKRALKGMLDLCMTLDPTLTCLFPDGNTGDKLQNLWRKRCAGPKSKLCSNQEYVGLVLGNARYENYYRSLCFPTRR